MDGPIQTEFFFTKGINKYFPGVHALKDVSIGIEKHQVHAVIGENGAGKSTLMNIFMGMYQPDAGDMYFKGKKVTIASPVDAQKLGIGIVPQELNLVPNMSVAENITLGAYPLRSSGLIDKNRQIEIAIKAISTLDARIDVRQKARVLSTAQQQLVQIAHVLTFGAQIIIFDEPTASLTTTESEHLFKLIGRLKEEGAAIFYISHRLDEILLLADTISVLRDGKHVGRLDARNTSKQEMVNLMVGREIVSTLESREYNTENRKPVLEVCGLTRKGEFEDISFTLHDGEILGVSGLVGAGRTELAMAVYGYTKADHGSVKIFDKVVAHKHPNEAIANNLAYIPEERRQQGIFPELSVAENMGMPKLKDYLKRLGIDFKALSADVQEYIGKLNIKVSSQSQKIKNLSGGNQQKVIIARWLLAGSKILILDEPTRGIDVNAKEEIHQLLRTLTENGLSILLISSEMEEVLNVSDRIVVMHEGKGKGIVKAKESTQESLLQLALS